MTQIQGIYQWRGRLNKNKHNGNEMDHCKLTFISIVHCAKKQFKQLHWQVQHVAKKMLKCSTPEEKGMLTYKARSGYRNTMNGGILAQHNTIILDEGLLIFSSGTQHQEWNVTPQLIQYSLHAQTKQYLGSGIDATTAQIVLDQFLRLCATLVVKRRSFPPVSVVTAFSTTDFADSMKGASIHHSEASERKLWVFRQLNQSSSRIPPPQSSCLRSSVSS